MNVGLFSVCVPTNSILSTFDEDPLEANDFENTKSSIVSAWTEELEEKDRTREKRRQRVLKQM